MTKSSNARLLLTGFTPFDGRTVNGSWIAANTYDAAEHLEIPVLWGAPLPHLEQAVKTLQPEVIVSMGEGRPGHFDIETRARNNRKHRVDNNYQYPNGPILADGEHQLLATINANSLRTTLAAQDIPIRVSSDAGQFICEETLYCLEYLKTVHECLQTVVFVHLPPFGTPLDYRGEHREANEPLLSDFVSRLVTAVLTLHQTEIDEVTSHHSENHG